MELKMYLAQIIRKFRILPGDKIKEGFKLDKTLVIQPNGIYIK
jgi:hypothetical protein